MVLRVRIPFCWHRHQPPTAARLLAGDQIIELSYSHFTTLSIRVIQPPSWYWTHSWVYSVKGVPGICTVSPYRCRVCYSLETISRWCHRYSGPWLWGGGEWRAEGTKEDFHWEKIKRITPKKETIFGKTQKTAANYSYKFTNRGGKKEYFAPNPSKKNHN